MRDVGKVLGFAAFGFPRGHAIAFARLAYESAWLRLHFPVEYYCALFNNQPMGFYASDVLVGDARSHGMLALQPDINRGGVGSLVPLVDDVAIRAAENAMLPCTLMYVITVHQPDSTMVSRELTGDRCIVGRTAHRADLVVVDPQVSGVQVEIGCDEDSLWLRDLGSSNGTTLQGLLLEPDRQYPLEIGQQVMIGGGSSLLIVERIQSSEDTQVALPTYKPRYIGVLYTDIVGSTRMTVALGHERATALLEWHNEMFRTRFKRFGGRETKYTGDGFEAVFTSVSGALGCAAACQRALARRNKEDPSGVHLDVRMGVNGGEAPSVKNRVYGMPLIVAARVMNEATAGQVLVSSHVPAIVAGSLLQFSPFGVHELKGLPEPMHLLEYRWELDPNVSPPTTNAAERL